MSVILFAMAAFVAFIALSKILETKTAGNVGRVFCGLVVVFFGVWLIQRGIAEDTFNPIVPGLIALAVGLFGIWTAFRKRAG